MLWDWTLFIWGAVPMIVFGAAMGNMLEGVPFHFSWDMVSYYTGSFVSLFNPFAMLCGLMSLALALYQGAPWSWGAVKASSASVPCAWPRSAARSRWCCSPSAVSGSAFMAGYVITAGADPAGAGVAAEQDSGPRSRCLAAQLRRVPGAVAAAGRGLCRDRRRVLSPRAAAPRWSPGGRGALAWAGTIGTVGAAMFPFLDAVVEQSRARA